jgi:hypothetical protein
LHHQYLVLFSTNTDQKGGMYGENQVSGAASSFARTLFLGRNWDLTKRAHRQSTTGAPTGPGGHSASV